MTEGKNENSDVFDQFREAASLLEAVRKRLEEIANSESAAAGARGSVESAAGSLREFLTSISAVVDQIAAAGRASVSAQEAAHKFLEGTDLSALRTSVESLPKKLETAIGDRMQQMDVKNASHQKNMMDETKKLTERIDDLAKTAGSVKEEQDKYSKLLEKYRDLYACIPQRARTKWVPEVLRPQNT